MNKIALSMALMLALISGCNDDAAKKDSVVDDSSINSEQGALERSKQYPAPIESIIEQGVEIIDTFDAPAGMMGYAGMMRGQPLAIYVTKDKQYAIVGTLIDKEGVNLTSKVMEDLVEGPRMARAWKELEDSNWIADGKDDAPVTIYTFTDPNCPYCYKFREAADPWIKAGKVQLRHIMVAILRKSSMDKAATIMGSKDPETMLQKHHEQFDQGGIEIDPEAIEKGQVRVQLNTNMMQRLGFGATPSSLFKDKDGKVKAIQGLPQDEVLETMMGSPKPQ
ncbi:thiol:disulfide interchange protein DsbG [Kangiella sediminilitoris]|uniref:Thiol:disulfide interchange protein n=1 Tax=Kangiella sediminilitoris TaxID=1144748 RepID=A0A1B3BE48_9GAMM|nr:thiol:disulfide interchange protein DsbG [Kangiella sediminilitoris]AOE51005.1 ABC transporter ATP-binding protein [Kangiella sediminilitoris]